MLLKRFPRSGFFNFWEQVKVWWAESTRLCDLWLSTLNFLSFTLRYGMCKYDFTLWIQGNS
jgi:hypothetical protein